ncbi:MAG: hypothetical protein HY820_18095 [Acidobacteria bacterium]|nr:hypothetical protein [Acidobacteriota bacterium]
MNHHLPSNPKTPTSNLSRRLFHQSCLGVSAATLLPAIQAAAGKKRVAGIVTEYRHYSHADVVLGRILGGYSANNVHHESRSRLVSLYTDQVPATDMSRDLSARFGFKIYPTIAAAMTLGSDKLAVDAVVFVGEHGQYPENELGQKMYPRYELFNQILDVYEKTGRVVPTFFDKHLSYSWEKAKGIYDRAKRLKVPWMAGSSIPVTIRTPLLEIPLETPIESAVCVGYGPHDAYGFHLLESLQCMIERRAGGETGIDGVEWVQGNAVFEWLASEGKWARPLIDEAQKRNPKRKPLTLEEESRNPVLFQLQYKSGLRAAALIVGPSGAEWSFAMRRSATAAVESTFFGLPAPGRPLPHFDGLVRCVDEMFQTGKPVYPVERTLLTTGALAFLFESKRRKGRVATPELAVSYRAPKEAWFQRA